MNFSKTAEWTRVRTLANAYFMTWLWFVYISYYFCFIYISNFTNTSTFTNFSNFIDFCQFLESFNLYGFSKPPNQSNIKFAKSVGFQLSTWSWKSLTLISWCRMQQKLDKNSHKCNNYIAAYCPGINLRKINLRKSYDLYSFKNFNQSKSRKSVFRQQINFCFV